MPLFKRVKFGQSAAAIRVAGSEDRRTQQEQYQSPMRQLGVISTIAIAPR